jgi:hypothetical protein
MSYRFVDSFRAAAAGSGWNRVPSWSCSKAIWHIPSLSVQWITPDDWQRNCPKPAEFHFQNKFEKLVHLVGFIVRTVAPCALYAAVHYTKQCCKWHVIFALHCISLFRHNADRTVRHTATRTGFHERAVFGWCEASTGTSHRCAGRRGSLQTFHSKLHQPHTHTHIRTSLPATHLPQLTYRAHLPQLTYRTHLPQLTYPAHLPQLTYRNSLIALTYRTQHNSPTATHLPHSPTALTYRNSPIALTYRNSPTPLAYRNSPTRSPTATHLPHSLQTFKKLFTFLLLNIYEFCGNSVQWGAVTGLRMGHQELRVPFAATADILTSHHPVVLLYPSSACSCYPINIRQNFLCFDCAQTISGPQPAFFF